MRALTLVLAFVLVAFLGCSDLTSPTTPSDAPAVGTETALGKWDNNPDNGNPRIWRGPVHWATSWTDPGTGLRATHTTVPLGDPVETDCGLLELIDPIAHQDVIFDPEDPTAGRVIHVVDDELWIIVRDVTQPGDCFGAKLIAEGYGDFHSNDNDVFFSVENNTNTWGHSGHGLLTTPDGGTLRYNGHIRFQAGFDVNDEFFFRVLSSQVVTKKK